MKISMQISMIELPYDPAIQLLALYPKEINLSYERNSYITMLIVTLLTLARRLNQGVHQQTNKRIKKRTHTHTYNRILFNDKKNKILPFAQVDKL